MNLRTLRIVGLENATHSIQLEVFPSVKEIKISPYYTIPIDMYGFVF